MSEINKKHSTIILIRDTGKIANFERKKKTLINKYSL